MKLSFEICGYELAAVVVDVPDPPQPVAGKKVVERSPVEAASTWVSRGVKKVSAAWVRGMVR